MVILWIICIQTCIKRIIVLKPHTPNDQSINANMRFSLLLLLATFINKLKLNAVNSIKRGCGFSGSRGRRNEERRITRALHENDFDSSVVVERTEVISVNMYLYVFINSEGEGNLTDADIQTQVQILNEGFSGSITNTSVSHPECINTDTGDKLFLYENAAEINQTPFEFNLKEVHRIEDNSGYYLDSRKSEKVMSGIRKNRITKCSEMFVFTGYSSKFCGWAYLPIDCADEMGNVNNPRVGDNVVISHDCWVDSVTLEGDTLIHEVGHWLGCVASLAVFMMIDSHARLANNII